MRALALLPMLMVAACGSGAAEKNEAAPAATANIAAGQWELTTEVTAFETQDDGAPRINTPVGTRATETVCVGAGRPSYAFFTGADFDCSDGSYYVRNGRMNVTLACRREGLSGQIPIAAEGTFTGDAVEFNRNVRTILSTDGDVELTQRVTGRRTGDCAPDASGDNAATPS